MHFRHKFILYTHNKTFNNGILLNGVLIAKLLNNPFASCFLTNPDLLISHLTYFDCIIILPFFVSKIFGSKFSRVFSALYTISYHGLLYKKSIKN